MKQIYNHMPYIGGVIVVIITVLLVSIALKNGVSVEENSKQGAYNKSQSISDMSSQNTNSIVEKNATFDIEVTYPFVQVDGKETNDFFSTLYAKKVVTFKNDVVAWNKDLTVPNNEKTYPSSYRVTFTEVASSSRYSSFLVLSEKFFTMSAHPSHDIDTFIYDKKYKKIVSVSDLFTSRDASLFTMLSKLSIEAFTRKNKQADDGAHIDTSSENEGFLPTAQHFSKVLPTPEGLTVYFEEYQIAPYVDGPQEVTLPYSKLKTIINQDGVLVEYK